MAKVVQTSNQRGEPTGHWMFWCPGCQTNHSYQVPRWDWNGDVDRPTFSPSLLVHGSRPHGVTRCHLFVTDGQIQYCADCGHDLAGQTAEMVDMEQT
jgi:hypothetical protein